MPPHFAAAMVLVLAVVLLASAAGPPGGRPGGGFLPRRVDTCGPAQDALPKDPAPAFHAWTGQDNKNWTAPAVPWDPDSKIQLTAAALAPSAREAHRPTNPVSRIGVTSRVRNWDNPFTAADGGGRPTDISSSPCSSAVSVYDVQPFQTGFLLPAKNDSTDGTMYENRYYYQAPSWSRASGPYGGPYHPLASCPEELGLDMNLASDGRYETMVAGREKRMFWWQQAGEAPGLQPWYDDRDERNLAELAGVGLGPAAGQAAPDPVKRLPSFARPRETLRSAGPAGAARPREALRSRGNARAEAAADGCLTGIGCGLGSTWIDPRFEPSPPALYPGGPPCGPPCEEGLACGDAVWAHGGHAGGPTFGSYTPSAFVPGYGGGTSRYVHGFGDGHLVAPSRRKK